MAEKPLCSVVGCGKPGYAKGHCRNHYFRLRTHGDPLAGKAAPGEPLAWLIQRVGSPAEECLIWPYARFPNGYAAVVHDGITTHASKVACELAHGPCSPDAPFALHSCGGGAEGCVNGRHLRWGTQTENMMDSVLAGTRARGERQHASKLTEAAVREIRLSRDRPGALAAKYGVHPETITRVRKRQAWAWLE